MGPEVIPSDIPCLVYVHSHSGNRLEGLTLIDDLLPDVNLCVFDCSGSGLSEGEYTTLGLKECRDLKCVIAHLKSHYKTGEIGLWGRSMGAVTCLMYAAANPYGPDISCMVLDSPFSDIKVLIGDTMKAMQNIPRWVTATALLAISGTIKKKTGSDVLGLKPIKVVKNITIPA
jgi:pimeloyl-ACP methyl ester carboxylesterase